MIDPKVDPIRAALWQHCLVCEHGIETGKEGGVIVARRGTKKLKGYTYYCNSPTLTYPKKVGSMSDWTGTIPLWCPVYLQQKEAARDSE